MRRTLLTAGAIALAGCPSVIRAQVAKHVEEPVNWAGAPVSDSVMSARLREAARQFRQYAPMPRIALYDLAYPADTLEYQRLRGNGVFLVTAVAQDSTELPVARVFLRDPAAGERELRRLGVACGHLPDTEVSIIGTFGTFRCDAFYVMPIELRAGTGDVLVDFAAHRQGFRVVQFDGEVPPAFRGLRPSGSAPVADSVFASLLAREYPGLAARILRR